MTISFKKYNFISSLVTFVFYIVYSLIYRLELGNKYVILFLIALAILNLMYIIYSLFFAFKNNKKEYIFSSIIRLIVNVILIYLIWNL